MKVQTHERSDGYADESVIHPKFRFNAQAPTIIIFFYFFVLTVDIKDSVTHQVRADFKASREFYIVIHRCVMTNHSSEFKHFHGFVDGLG